MYYELTNIYYLLKSIIYLIQIFDAGWLGKGDEKLTKTLSESQSLPTSKLGDFENFVCSKWIDMLNNAWTGNSYFIYSV